MSALSTFPVHSRENQILLIASRPGNFADIQPLLEDYLDSDIDWTELIRSAIKHRVVPLLGSRLIQVGPPLVPPDIIEALNFRLQLNKHRSWEIENALEEVATEMAAHSIEGVLFEGQSFIQLLYQETELREPLDPLLCVPAQDIEALNNILLGLDYKLLLVGADSEGAKHRFHGISLRSYLRIRDGNRSLIEVCSEMIPPHISGVFDSSRVIQRAKFFHGSPVLLKTPAAEDLLVTWSVFGGMSEWADLLKLCDIAWLIHTHRNIDLQSALSRVKGAGVERFVFLALGLIQHTFGVTLSPVISKYDSPVHRMIPHFASNLLLESEKTTTLTWNQLRLRTCFGARSRYFAQALLDKFSAATRRNDESAVTDTAASARAINSEHWSKRSDAWEKWSDLTRTRSAEISRVLIDTAAIKPGYRVLDVACGVGDTSLELSPLVGVSGYVVAVDLSFDMVHRTRRRGSSEALANLLACTTTMESLPFGNQSFEGIVCRLGIMYCPEVQRALLEALRVLRKGGRAAYMVCGPRKDNPVLRIINEVSTELFDLTSEEGTIDPFRFSTEESLAKQMEQAGFIDVEEGDLKTSQYVSVGTSFWKASFERGLSLDLDQFPVATRRELERRMARAFEPYIRGDFYELTSLSRITSGSRP